MLYFIKNEIISLKNATFASLNHQKTNKMLQEITIKNFKSIENDTIKLGRVNVFIGENGCGKSNILEAVAFLSAANDGLLSNEHLFSKGIRVAKPELTISNFKKKVQKKEFEIHTLSTGNKDGNKYIFKTDIDNNWDMRVMIGMGFESKAEISFMQELVESIEKFLPKGLLNKNNIPESLAVELLNKITEKQITEKQMNNLMNTFSAYGFLIYALNTPALRGFTNESRKEPVGIYGENLDYLIANFDKNELQTLKKYNYLIEWLADFDIDREDNMKFNGYKPNRSKSKLFFKDKFMATKNNLFSAENANEGVLHILFYLSVMISKRTPKFFAIDNIESCLNPHLCTNLMKEICTLAKEQDKQLLITTHNPAILDGLNLNDDEIRLFEVSRNRAGHTVTRRITVKPEHEQQEGRRLKLSELWTRGYLGAISEKY